MRRVRQAPLCAVVLCAALLVGVLGLASAPTASAFDTGPHFDVTRDALAAEGFNDRAIQSAQVSNWFVDLYENAGSVPFSGHAGFFKELIGGASPLSRFWAWPTPVVEAADRTHFDASGGGFSNTAQVTAEWDRLRRAVGAMAIEARDRNDPVQLISVLGISLHQVQDFYSHTNWLEGGGPAAGQGPNWASKGFGATPTWFDLPATVRDAEYVYTGGSTGIGRNHGSWKADGNLDLSHFNAKDWAGRPLYVEAHTAAYFATRQWVRAIRAYVNDERFWARAMNLATTPGLLAKDQKGALNISVASGHWQGQGEPCNPSFSTFSCGDRNGPGGSLLDLRGAIIDYFEPVVVKSTMRTLFERNITRVHGDAAGPAFEVPSSRDLQATTRFVKLEATSMAEVDNLDIPGQADMFVRAAVAGQRYVSGVVNDRDTFRFPRPHAPYTFIKSVPAAPVSYSTPVTSIRVRIHTGDVRFAGTDDDVYLRISNSLRFPLDKSLYNDFERDDDDTYSVPIDGAVADGLRVGDISYLQIEKSRDGVAGGWRLGGATVWVNDRRVVQDDSINRWLEDDHRVHRLGRPSLPARTGPGAPLYLALWEMDAAIRGDNDHTDTNPLASRRDTLFTYVPGSPTREGVNAGGDRYGGRLDDGDRARLGWRAGTITPVLPTQQFPGPATPPPVPPDLRVTAFVFQTGFTVTNAGPGPAGPFVVSVNHAGNFAYPGLAPGASIAQSAPQGCSGGATYSVTVDSARQVAESDEANNVATIGPVVC